MTTSSSLPRISEILPAIHLETRGTLAYLPFGRVALGRGVVGSSLLHDLQIDLLHVHLLAELGWELGRLQQPSIHACRHVERSVRNVCS